VHLGLTAISGHYVCYVLVDPGVIIKSKAHSPTSSDAQDTHCEPDMAAAAVADPMDGTSTAPHPVDNRVWCYCSEYVPPFLACRFHANLTLLAGFNHSTSVRLASLDEVLKAKAYMCFVSHIEFCYQLRLTGHSADLRRNFYKQYEKTK
jgi:ubiquitin carboxyl-terminal hydrolase 16/45